MEELLHIDNFQCPKTVHIVTLPEHPLNYLQDKKSHFIVPVIIASLSKSFFKGKWQFGFSIDTQHFLYPISPRAVILICVIICHIIDEWKSGSFTQQKFEAGANFNSNLFFLYSCSNYLCYAITDSNISHIGTDKGYMDRLVNKVPEPDFRASATGHLKKTSSNYTQQQPCCTSNSKSI